MKKSKQKIIQIKLSWNTEMEIGLEWSKAWEMRGKESCEAAEAKRMRERIQMCTMHNAAHRPYSIHITLF